MVFFVLEISESLTGFLSRAMCDDGLRAPAGRVVLQALVSDCELNNLLAGNSRRDLPIALGLLRLN